MSLIKTMNQEENTNGEDNVDVKNNNTILNNQLENIFNYDQKHIVIYNKLIIQHDIYGIINLEKYKDLYCFSIESEYVKFKKINMNHGKYKILNHCEKIRMISFSNVLVELDNLPITVEDLSIKNCDANDLDMINLPNQLKKLNCTFNSIETLNNLPLGLRVLICNNNKIYQLDYLPETLEYLHCSCNKLLSLNNLPRGLVHLECSNNLITHLDSLPNSLIEVNASSNYIVSILNLPSNLTRANFTDNLLMTTPKCSNSMCVFV